NGVSGATSTARTHNLVVGDVLPSPDLSTFTFDPRSPFPHAQGVADPLHVELGIGAKGVKDLAGNPLRAGAAFPFINFRIDPLEQPAANASIVLRFESPDEYGPAGTDPDGRVDLRGQFFYDTNVDNGRIIPRPVSITGWPVDRSNPLPGSMTRLATGV